jgi:FKBP-type peptidyl-prolyl cis-trans isomerase FkpA
MPRLIITACMCLLTIPALTAAELKTEDEKTLYSIGAIIARSLAQLTLTPAEKEFVLQGFSDAVSGKKPEVDPAAYNEKIQELARGRMKAQSEKLVAGGKEFLDKAAAEKGAVKTDSGMVYLSLKEGTGDAPSATSTVKVNYRGTLIDGKEFDSSYSRGTPAEFPLNGVIKCWGEGVQKMKPGGKARMVCPSALAYGDNGAGDMIPPGATLVFEVELLEVKK